MKVPKMIIASVRRIDNNESCYIYVSREEEEKKKKKKLGIFAKAEEIAYYHVPVCWKDAYLLPPAY
jgi:hypothetical protein